MGVNQMCGTKLSMTLSIVGGIAGLLSFCFFLGFFLGMNLPNIYINDYKSTSCTVIDQYPLESRIVAYDCNCNSYGYCQTCYRTEYLASIELTVNLPTGAQNMTVCDKDECIK